MDSLLANYASSDEEEQPAPPRQRIPPAKPIQSESGAGEEKNEDFLPKSASKRSGIFNSLPPPKSSIFNSLPPPKSQSLPNPKPQSGTEHQREVGERNVENPKPKSSSTSLFSSLPAPKLSSSSAASKKVVQFRPPTITNPYSSIDDDDEDEDEGVIERKRKRSKESISTSSATSFLSSIPAPRYSSTLGALPSSSGTSRRSMLETDAPVSNVSTVNASGTDAFVNPDLGYSNDQSNETSYDYTNVNGDQSHEIYDHSSSVDGQTFSYYGAYGEGSTDLSSVNIAGSDAAMNSNIGSYESVDYSYVHGQHMEHANYGNAAQYENNWANATEVSGVVDNALQFPGKRGRKDAPAEILEVKQDELMKNRPREDQVKLTGIAFGPAYKPASTKGKPTKLHKRKHQIGSLYFEMRQKEMELAERRSKGFLTKAQTQAKYGW